MQRSGISGFLVAALALAACASDSGDESTDGKTSDELPVSTAGIPTPSTGGAAGGVATSPPTPSQPAAAGAPSTQPPAAPPPSRPMSPRPMGGGMMTPPMPAPPMMPPATPPGPDDGDPSQPVIAIPNIACGPGRVLGLPQPNVMIGGRGVHVAYPCNKHKGAPATFILNLHGTMPTENIKLYQVGYFSAHNLVDSHNLIMVAPKAVGSQWGNGDNGADQPHLMEVIEWVYDTFKDFDIRAMWVGGHSWGSAYTARFGCSAELADKVKGLILMSGGGSATCQSKISLIISMAEGDGRMPTDQSSLASSHGCMAAKKEMILMNDYTHWDECMPGYVHANYYMLGKQHETFMDADVVKSIADLVKKARL